MIHWRTVSTAALCAATAASPAVAAEVGLPQLDPTWFGNQLFWLAISFGALFVFVSRFIVPGVSGVLKTRESAINDAIAEAVRAKALAEATHGNAASDSQIARTKAAELMAAAQAENSKEAAAALQKLDHELERKAGHAEAVLDAAVLKAQGNIEEASQSLAEAITAALLGSHEMADANAPKLKLAVKR